MTKPLLLAVLLSATTSIIVSAAQPEFLPPLPTGKEWKLIWSDEFDGQTLDETKWNRLGDSERRDGYWVKEDAYLNGKGTLLLRTKKRRQAAQQSQQQRQSLLRDLIGE